MTSRCKVLIVDDSRSFRAALEQALAGCDDVSVVGSVYSGSKALEFIRDTPPDLVTLDVIMPGMDGLQTLRAIQQFNAGRAGEPPVGVIMVSAYTSEGADLTVQALQGGAFDYVTKPQGPSAEANVQALTQQLLGKIRQYSLRRLVPRPAGTGRDASPAPEPPGRPECVSHRPRRAHPIRAILIAVSTGGPAALARLLPELCERTELPILIVQHISAHMIEPLADSLALKCSHAVVLARDGAPIQPRTIYLAPGDRHLVVRQAPGGQPITTLTEQPPESGFRPSADVLFRSAALAYGNEAVALVLTGMLSDGTNGLRPLKRAGAHVIAQDEATSVVWGMPGSAVASGLVDEVLPLNRIAAAVQAVVESGRRA
jgi:two-component system chemotaxis response regulator CheB